MLTSKLSNCEYFVSANNLILSTMVFFSILTDCNCFNKFMKLFKNWRCTLKDVSLVDSLFWCSKVSSCLILLIFFYRLAAHFWKERWWESWACCWWHCTSCLVPLLTSSTGWGQFTGGRSTGLTTTTTSTTTISFI